MTKEQDPKEKYQNAIPKLQVPIARYQNVITKLQVSIAKYQVLTLAVITLHRIACEPFFTDSFPPIFATYFNKLPK